MITSIQGNVIRLGEDHLVAGIGDVEGGLNPGDATTDHQRPLDDVGRCVGCDVSRLGFRPGAFHSEAAAGPPRAARRSARRRPVPGPGRAVG